MDEELIIQEIEDNTEEYIEFLRDLIQIESYNPPGNEKNVALVIQQYLKDANIESEIFPFGDNRANLIATLKFKPIVFRLCFGHDSLELKRVSPIYLLYRL